MPAAWIVRAGAGHKAMTPSTREVDDYSPGGEDKGRVGIGRAVRTATARFRLEFITQVADEAEVKVERQRRIWRHGPFAQLAFQIVEDRRYTLFFDRTLPLYAHDFGADVIGEVLRQRPGRIAHHGEARPRIDRSAAVQPERAPPASEQTSVEPVRVGVILDVSVLDDIARGLGSSGQRRRRRRTGRPARAGGSQAE